MELSLKGAKIDIFVEEMIVRGKGKNFLVYLFKYSTVTCRHCLTKELKFDCSNMLKTLIISIGVFLLFTMTVYWILG